MTSGSKGRISEEIASFREVVQIFWKPHTTRAEIMWQFIARSRYQGTV